MSTIETGGPAFPVSTINETGGHQDGPNTWQFPGMTLRDYFAAKAMPYYTAQPGESATIRAQVAPGRWEDVPRRSEANK